MRRRGAGAPRGRSGPTSLGASPRGAPAPRRAERRGERTSTAEYVPKEELTYVYAALMPANRLACQVAEHTGLRIGDVLALRTEQLRSQRITVREAKTGKTRRIYLPRKLHEELKTQAGEAWVFPSPRDPAKHRTRQAVWADIKRAAKAFRLPQQVSPHSLRKIYAVDEWERTGDLGKVGKQLNHSPYHPETTMIYAMARELYRRRYGNGRG